MSEQRLSLKKTFKYREKYPELKILKVTTWGHDKALWCVTGLYILSNGELELHESWDGYGRVIGDVLKDITWKKEFGEEYKYEPGEENEN